MKSECSFIIGIKKYVQNEYCLVFVLTSWKLIIFVSRLSPLTTGINYQYYFQLHETTQNYFFSVISEFHKKPLTRSQIITTLEAWAAHSQDFGEFDFINLLSIFSSRNHPLEVAVC